MTSTITTGDSASGAESDALRACTLLRLPEVLRARGRSRSSHYGDVGVGLFTRPVSLGANCVGWPEDEVIALNRARIAGMSDEGIRTLVLRLEALRKREGFSMVRD